MRKIGRKSKKPTEKHRRSQSPTGRSRSGRLASVPSGGAGGQFVGAAVELGGALRQTGGEFAQLGVGHRLAAFAVAGDLFGPVGGVLQATAFFPHLPGAGAHLISALAHVHLGLALGADGVGARLFGLGEGVRPGMLGVATGVGGGAFAVAAGLLPGASGFFTRPSGLGGMAAGLCGLFPGLGRLFARPFDVATLFRRQVFP